MKKSLTAALAAITFGGAVAATAMPAEAFPHGGYYRGGGYYHGHNGTGTAIAAGAVGLALGAAIAGNHGYSRGYAYERPYYGPGYYAADPYYASYYAPRVCEGSHWVWDPYARRNILVRSEYAC